MTRDRKRLLRVLEAMEALRELDENRLRQGQARMAAAERDLREVVDAASRDTETAAAFPEIYARHAQRLSDEIRSLEEQAKADAQAAARSGVRRDRVAERYLEARGHDYARKDQDARAEFTLSRSGNMPASPPQASRRNVKLD
jgi:hypothetical protein